MGRIARKIRRELERALRQKTASFEAFRRGKERAETIKSLGQLLREGIDPLHALYANTTGGLNVAIGSSALAGNISGSGNIGIGFLGGSNVTTANNVIAIGVPGNNVDNSCYIGQVFGATSSNGIGVFVNSNGRLGTATSSKRFKEDIKPMDRASDALWFYRGAENDPDDLLQRAVTALNQAARLSLTREYRVEAYQALANIFQTEERRPESLAALEKIATLQPNNWPASLRMAAILQQMGQQDGSNRALALSKSWRTPEWF